MGQLSNLSLLVKPASALCNMRCRYCFYAEEAARREQAVSGMMAEETARGLIDAAIEAVSGHGEITFAFQGGEPTLAGLDFFRRFCAYAEERAGGNHRLHWSIQTNGLRLDPEWAEFLREHRFLAGVSLDGTEALHDAFRPDAEGNGTWSRVCSAVKLLRKNRVETNLLCVVTGPAARQPRKVYRTMQALGARHFQFIPCLEPQGAPPGGREWSLDPADYGRFLSAVFDLWMEDWKRGQYISIRAFEDWIRVAAGLPAEMCATCGQCGGYLAAEADGSLYPCDFYALDEWLLGNVKDGLLPAMESARMLYFRRLGAEKPAACRSCRFFSLCRGGCPRNRQAEDGQIVNGLCAAYQIFFSAAEERIRSAAAALRESRSG